MTNPEGEPAGTELFFPTDKLAKVKISQTVKAVPPLTFVIPPYTGAMGTCISPAYMSDMNNPSLAAAREANNPAQFGNGSTAWDGLCHEPFPLPKSGTGWNNENREAGGK